MLIIHFIVLQQIEDILNSLLVFYHDHIGGSWGWSIVLLTATVRIAILPLTIKQFRNMAGDAADPAQGEGAAEQVQGEERPRFEGADAEGADGALQGEQRQPVRLLPAAVVQMPIFIGLYQTLSNFGATNDKSFLFISDIFVHTNNLPRWQTVLMVLLYSSSMLGSTLLFSFVQDRQQKYLFASMSVIFIPFILRVPAGVGVYWITTNIWTICQQGIVKRQMAHHFPAVEKEQKQKAATQTRSSRTPPKKPPEQRPRGKSKRRR